MCEKHTIKKQMTGIGIVYISGQMSDKIWFKTKETEKGKYFEVRNSKIKWLLLISKKNGLKFVTDWFPALIHHISFYYKRCNVSYIFISEGCNKTKTFFNEAFDLWFHKKEHSLKVYNFLSIQKLWISWVLNVMIFS